MHLPKHEKAARNLAQLDRALLLHLLRCSSCHAQATKDNQIDSDRIRAAEALLADLRSVLPEEWPGLLDGDSRYWSETFMRVAICASHLSAPSGGFATEVLEYLQAHRFERAHISNRSVPGELAYLLDLQRLLPEIEAFEADLKSLQRFFPSVRSAPALLLKGLVEDASKLKLRLRHLLGSCWAQLENAWEPLDAALVEASPITTAPAPVSFIGRVTELTEDQLAALRHLDICWSCRGAVLGHEGKHSEDAVDPNREALQEKSVRPSTEELVVCERRLEHLRTVEAALREGSFSQASEHGVDKIALAEDWSVLWKRAHRVYDLLQDRVIEWEPAEQKIGYEFAEKSLLRLLVKEPSLYEAATTGVKASDFLDKRNSAIFTCIMQLRDLGAAISWQSIETRLQEAGQLGLVGGRGYLMSVDNEEGCLASFELFRRLFRNSRGSIGKMPERKSNEVR